MKEGRRWRVFALLGLIIVSLACGDSSQPTQEATQPTHTPLPASTPVLQDTPQPADTPAPTHTPAPTDAPQPTATPLPTETPTPAPEPITIAGDGDDIVDVDRPQGLALLHVTGNEAAHHFAVTSYDKGGETIDLLVNTTEPYEGYRPLDFASDEHATRFEISATGPWTLEIIPLSPERIQPFMLDVPGEFEGEGDLVIFLMDGEPDLATIVGNEVGRYLGVIGYGQFSELLVNTTDPYEGTVIVAGLPILEIRAEGPWRISVTEKS